MVHTQTQQHHNKHTNAHRYTHSSSIHIGANTQQQTHIEHITTQIKTNDRTHTHIAHHIKNKNIIQCMIIKHIHKHTQSNQSNTDTTHTIDKRNLIRQIQHITQTHANITTNTYKPNT